MLEAYKLDTLIPGIPLRCHADNQAGITIVRKGYSAKRRHGGKTRRVNVAQTCELVTCNVDMHVTDAGEEAQKVTPLTTCSCCHWAFA